MLKKPLAAARLFALFLALGTATAFADAKEVTIKIAGMTCGGCAASLQQALQETPGVLEAKVSYEKGEAWVKYDDRKITLARLREVINSTGFKAVEEKPAKKASAKGDPRGSMRVRQNRKEG